jgi:uncharacterized membrane protein YfcA
MLAVAQLETVHLLLLPVIGLLCGVVGGLFGLGGGLVLIPVLLLMLGGSYGPGSLHVYKLAALLMSVVLSVPATVRQVRARAVVPRVLTGVIGFAVCGAIAGVMLASVFSHERSIVLAKAFGVFLLLAVFLSALWRSTSADPSLRCATCPAPQRWSRFGLVVGLPAGLVAGLLGVAGGVWAVPAQNLLLGVRLRNAIANSTAMIVVVGSVAALAQGVSVWRMGLSPLDGGWLALCVAPGALVGGWLGASLAHVLPVRALRWAFYGVLLVMGVRLLS